MRGMSFSASAPKLAPIPIDRRRTPDAAPLNAGTPNAVPLTRDMAAELSRLGRLPQKFELVEGEIIDKMAQGLPHRVIIVILMEWLFASWGRPYIQDQASIDVAPGDNPTSEPQPDLTALKVPLASLKKNPQPKQIDLVIEVSDATLDYDLKVKAGLYARAGIPEFWVADVPNRLFHVFRTPRKGVYKSVAVYNETQTISPSAQPQASLQLSTVFAK
jgi:Uma2 family endonuclease